ncbi:MAG: inorganic phosphate transporter, partial [Planctomycetales bacterium]|nr:inorganic phosphate transporter [Planctomycetales bacterium]
DNFKGVATLLGSGTTNFSRAILWATGCTLAGSVVAITFASVLLKNFSGKGLVEETLVTQPSFAAAVALGAALTVLIATRLGLPVSTTHGLLGALLGTGLAAGSSIAVPNLLSTFMAPLLISPLLAVAAVMVVYPVLRQLRIRLGIHAHTCLCVGHEVVETMAVGDTAEVALCRERLTVTHGHALHCRSRYSGSVLGIEAEATLNKMHFLSAGIVSFARGLNDTPKMAALLLVAPAIDSIAALCLVGCAIAAGGYLNGRRVAETMSHKITAMNHGQGFTANLLTGLIVIGASRLGMPVSTTHVSCGTLFGLGTVSGSANRKVIFSILAAWVITLPLGALAGALTWTFLGGAN